MTDRLLIHLSIPSIYLNIFCCWFKPHLQPPKNSHRPNHHHASCPIYHHVSCTIHHHVSCEIHHHVQSTIRFLTLTIISVSSFWTLFWSMIIFGSGSHFFFFFVTNFWLWTPYFKMPYNYFCPSAITHHPSSTIQHPSSIICCHTHTNLILHKL
jgi:hypothetical protein